MCEDFYWVGWVMFGVIAIWSLLDGLVFDHEMEKLKAELEELRQREAARSGSQLGMHHV